MNHNCILSICIPTFQRPEIVKETLQSIYAQKVKHSLFEVCISDNSPTDETKDMLEKEFDNVDNLRYCKSACEGFLNSMEALKMGKGLFLKLHNDYSAFCDGGLVRMLQMIKKYEEERAVLFFSFGCLKNKKKVMHFKSFNDFMNNIDYWCTWSSAFGIWKDDFDQLMQRKIDVNYMYPHTTLLFQLADHKKYVVDNYNYVNNLKPKKKGGYNLVDNFVRIFLTMLEEVRNAGNIDDKVYKKIENHILKFVASWYNASHHDESLSFTYDNYPEIIRNQCGELGLLRFRIMYVLIVIKYTVVMKIKKRK